MSNYIDSIYTLSAVGRTGVSLPKTDVPLETLPEEEYLRGDLELPEVSEVDLCRHYTALSQLNLSVDTNFYPLGSCTMKYNPKVNELTASLPEFLSLHPLSPEKDSLGALEMMAHLGEIFIEIGGFSHITLQPAAGASGEFAGVLMMRKFMVDKGEYERSVLLIPDTAHGTNPASANMCGLSVLVVKSDGRGNIDLSDLKEKTEYIGKKLLGIMLTNPNTLGLYEENLAEVIDIIHSYGGLVYGDGANLNALLGAAQPGKMGFDVMHYNLHKTFATPHGGGGPGAGAILVNDKLKDFLPSPIIKKDNTGKAVFYNPEKSIGQTKLFYGNFAVMVKAYTYLRIIGKEGIAEIGKNAVLNANYLQKMLGKWYNIPHGDRYCMHEFVATGDISEGVHAFDIAKALIDMDIHPPTVYFPLVIKEALMIEPTETESLETLDNFIEVMGKIAEIAKNDPDILSKAPSSTIIGRLDEVKAARDMTLVNRNKK